MFFTFRTSLHMIRFHRYVCFCFNSVIINLSIPYHQIVRHQWLYLLYFRALIIFITFTKSSSVDMLQLLYRAKVNQRFPIAQEHKTQFLKVQILSLDTMLWFSLLVEILIFQNKFVVLFFSIHSAKFKHIFSQVRLKFVSDCVPDYRELLLFHFTIQINLL